MGWILIHDRNDVLSVEVRIVSFIIEVALSMYVNTFIQYSIVLCPFDLQECKRHFKKQYVLLLFLF